MSSRRDAREHVMKALYAYEQADSDPDHLAAILIDMPLEDDPSTREFAERLFRTTLDTMDEADEIIEKHAKNWEIHRIAVIDRCLLRMATTELLKFEEIPPRYRSMRPLTSQRSTVRPGAGPSSTGLWMPFSWTSTSRDASTSRAAASSA